MNYHKSQNTEQRFYENEFEKWKLHKNTSRRVEKSVKAQDGMTEKFEQNHFIAVSQKS